ncbi:uncharacterized protein [Chiloscyllium punctatum]|uniref:uncharacterized protein isoform X1 n=1 Tax=Chiloscyllium punctatum TaxID=137246 RepID=UPI003B63EAAE
MKIYFVLVFAFTQHYLSESEEQINMNAQLGSDVTFPGPKVQTGHTSLKWLYTNGKSILILAFINVNDRRIGQPSNPYKNRITYNADTLSFMLKNIKATDEGTYTLREAAHGSIINVKLIINITVEIEVYEGSDVKIPGPENPEKYTLTIWTFSRLLNTINIVEFYGSPDVPKGFVTSEYKDRIITDARTLSFVLQKVRMTDFGTYKLHNVDAQEILKHVELIVIQQQNPNPNKPQISSNSSLGNTIIALTCSVPVKVLTIEWLAFGKAIHDVRYRLVNNNRTLIIDMAEESDSGTYTCIVYSEHGKTSSFYQLRIEFGVYIPSSDNAKETLCELYGATSGLQNAHPDGLFIVA